MARLTTDQWSSVRAKREAGLSFPALAKEFGVSHQAIQKRAKIENWAIPPFVAAPWEVLVQRQRLAIARQAERRALRDSAEKQRLLNGAARSEARNQVRFGKAGFVYVVCCEHAGRRWHKIGVAKDFRARLPVIQTGCPLPVSEVALVESADSRNLEKELHAMFSHRRISGEWFELEADEVSHLCETLRLRMESEAINGADHG